MTEDARAGAGPKDPRCVHGIPMADACDPCTTLSPAGWINNPLHNGELRLVGVPSQPGA